jgi:serine/threonine protein kinase
VLTRKLSSSKLFFSHLLFFFFPHPQTYGQVRVVTDKRSGTEFAAKSIPKRLDAPGLAPERQAAHVENIRREVAVLRRLRGTLNVVALEGAFEDAESVHIVMVRMSVLCV